MPESQEREIVVLFTDICGYTRYFSTKGTTAGVALRNRHDEIAKPVISQFGGTYVKSTGDGMIAYFEEPRKAIEASVKIQEKFAAYNEGCAKDEQIHIRIGIQSGSAVTTEEDIIGQAVNFAARLVAVCRPDQILIGKELYRKLRRVKHVNLKKIGSTSLQGIPQPEDVFEVGWQFEVLEEKSKATHLHTTGIRVGAKKPILAMLAVALIAAVGIWLVRNRKTEDQSNPPRGSVSNSSSGDQSSPARKLYSLGIKALRDGDDDQALENMNQAIGADTSFVEAYLDAAYICVQNDQYDKGRDYLDKLPAASKLSDPTVRLNVEALLFELEDNEDEALKKYDTLAGLKPEDTDTQYHLGDLALQMGRLDKARTALKKCIELSPESPFCHFDWMQLQVYSNDFSGVVRYYESLRVRNIRYPWFDQPLGYAFLGMDDIPSAQARFQTLKETWKKLHGKLHFRAGKDALANLAFYQGNTVEATRRLEQSMQESKSAYERSDYLLTLARNWELLGNKANAKSAAVSATKGSIDALTFIGSAKILALLGDREAVHTLLNRKMPNGKPLGEIEPATKNLIAGSFALAQRNPKKAVEHFKQSGELREDIDTTYLLGQAYMAADKCDDAESTFSNVLNSKGIVLSDSTPLIWVLAHYNLGRCYQKQGKESEALKYYSKFVEIWKDADADLAQVIEAKQQIVKLQHSGQRL